MVGVDATSNRSKGAGQLMIMNLLIALAAGCASALMFASIISGALISLLLFYLAPLPLMMAALGWGATAAALGGLAAALGLGAIFSLPYCFAFVLTVALPACWLGHLALLGRDVAAPVTAGNGAAPLTPHMEWYPVGRIIAWIAGFAALTTMAALFSLGSDGATITTTLRSGLLRVLGARDATPGDADRLVEALAAIAPAAASIVAMMTLTLNLWLAAKITAASGRLNRPWPDLKGAALPPMTLVALSLAIACCFVGGLLAIIGQTVSAALLMAYALVGFAVLHTLTLPIRHRPFVLSSTYALVLVFGWPVLALVALGIADALLGLRQRYAQRGKPPPLTTT
jgi:hypothetical protein